MSTAPHKWRDLMEPVTAAKDAFGLNPTDLSVFRAILSFIPSDVLSLARPEGHICFAQNTTIAERLGRSGDSTVNRSIRRLEQAGLVARRHSGNRKRYARRSGAGEITHAYGIDLEPAIALTARIAEEAIKAAKIKEQLHRMREDCREQAARLGAIVAKATSDGLRELENALEQARRVLRRKPNEHDLAQLKRELQALYRGMIINDARCTSDHTASQPPASTSSSADLSSSDRQSEQHKDSVSNTSDKERTSQISFEDLEQSFPTMMSCLRTSRDMDDFHRRADALAESLGDAGQSWREIKHDHGFQVALLMLGYVVQHHDRIANHGGYLRSLGRKMQGGEMSLAALLAKSQPVHPDRTKHSTVVGQWR